MSCLISLAALGSCATDDSIDAVDPVGTAIAEADPEAVLLFGIGLPRDDAGLAEFALAVSDPADPSYGDHVSAKEVGRRFGADDDTVDPILEMFADAGVDATVDPSRALISAPMTVAQAADMFETEFAVYETGAGTQLIETVRPPTVPSGLQGAEEIIGFEEPVREPPVADLRLVASAGSPGSAEEPCAEAMSVEAADLGDVFREYGIASLHDQGFTGAGRTAAVITVSTFDNRALDAYASCFGTTLPPTALHLVESGQPFPSTGEAAMDIELLASVAPDLDRIDVFQTTAHGLAAPVFALAAAIDPANTGGRPPDVISASLGWCEQGIADHVLDLLDHQLLVAAAIGSTIVSAAGNHGTAGCYPSSTARAPHFPASSPWSLAIGGTALAIGADGAVTEAVWNDGDTWAGGGGESVRYDLPGWQNTLGGADGRRYPDLALFADSALGYAVSYCPAPGECGWTALGGTSAATPIAAGAIALVNQARASHGAGPVGLLAPVLYAAAESGELVARDITDGDNRLFGHDCCDASVGFDQASGWGAPDFATIAAL
ncbi:MAG: S53 family peptidase [Acidimicrobiia bacterium]|nr:S53 family peptidase [Acidimicrobiia bacterium]